MEKLTVKELKAVAKEKGLKGYSTLKKAELIELISMVDTEQQQPEKACETACKVASECDSSKGCPMILGMLKEAGFNNMEPMKVGGQFNTPELRRENVQGKMEKAKNNIIIDCDTDFTITSGNAKMTNIYNFALAPIVTCPFATRNCIMKCYGFKQYFQNIADTHYKNMELTKREDFVQKMFQKLVSLSANQKMQNEIFGTNQKITFRIHTVGDFYSQEYFNKWMEIVELCQIHNLPIDFGCYTKSVTFVRNYLKQTGKNLKDLNINIMFSAWNDTPEKFLIMAEELEMNVFAVTNKNYHMLENAGYEKCADDILKGSCGTICKKCYVKEEGEKVQIDNTKRKLIAIELH